MDIYCDAFVAQQRHELDSAPVVLSAASMRACQSRPILRADATQHAPQSVDAVTTLTSAG